MRKHFGIAVQMWLTTLLVVLSPAVAQAIAATAVEGEQRFHGINFGAGVGVVGTPSNRLAKNPRVVNNTVRVDDDSNLTASVVLESHYFWTPHPLIGHGPFVALKLAGDNQIIDAIGVGWMFGLRYDEKATNSWNFGAGLSVRPSATVLGDGITKNSPLPPGDEIRTKTTSLLGFMVFASFTWDTLSIGKIK